MQDVLRHKRRRKKGLALGSDSPLGKAIDVLVYPVGVAGVLSAVPQIAEVWMNHNTTGISVFTWSAWAFFSFIWILYGIVHKAPAVIFLNTAWFFVNASVALGAYLYS
jgi:uncharacterized protein with PQ loop repeat